MIVTYIHSNNPEDALRVQQRCRNFAGAINRSGCHSANLVDLNSFVKGTLEAYKTCARSDLLVIHRYLYGPVLQAVEYWKARDKKVIVDFDQALNYLTPDIPGYAFWLQGKPLGGDANADQTHESQIDEIPLEQFKWGLGLIDAAVVSSPRLMVDWSQFTDVYEIPDYLNTDQYPAIKHVHENQVWIGLANGTRIATMDKSGLRNALESVCEKRRQVKLIQCQCNDPVSCLPDLRRSQTETYPLGFIEEWADLLTQLDIGLAPSYGDFDLRLSRINILEFMISKTPWIASQQPAFQELSRYGRLVQNSSNAWEIAILKAVDNIDILRKRAAGEPFLFALSQDVNENIDKVIKLFTYILDQGE